MSEQIKFGTWNINGLGKNAEKLKDYEFQKLVNMFDIFSLVETWHTPHTKISLKGYDSLQITRPKKYRKGRNSGGVIVYVKHSIRKGVTQLKSKISDTIWLKLDKKFLFFKVPLKNFDRQW